MRKFKFNKVYKFDLTGKIQFGDIPIEVLHNLFKDGRLASHMMERFIEKTWSDLEFTNKKGYDFICKKTGDRYDQKTFTKRGGTYIPSNMIGVGRKLIVEEMHNHAMSTNYIFVDVVDFPKIKIIFKEGKQLVEKYPTGKIHIDKKNVFFSDDI
jgi:hypothetical protein